MLKFLKIFTVISIITESTLKLINDTRSNIFGNAVWVYLNTTSYLDQFMMFFNDFFNLVPVAMNIIKSSYGKTRLRDFFSTFRVISLTTSMLIINFLSSL